MIDHKFNLDDKKDLIEEFEFCLNQWKEKWSCSFGWKTNCSTCASLYLLWKLISWEKLDWQCLTFQDWEERLKDFKKTN